MPLDHRRLTRKILIERHNYNVVQVFKHAHGRDVINEPEAAVRNACLIKTKDTDSLAILKVLLFSEVLGFTQHKLSMPELYTLQASNIPQLCITYIPIHYPKQRGYYQFTIPHYAGSHVPPAPFYHKGKHYRIWKLKDGSTLQAYANSDEGALQMLETYRGHINPQFKPAEFNPRKGEVSGHKHKQIELKPFRADYYPQGLNSGVVEWQHWYGGSI